MLMTSIGIEQFDTRFLFAGWNDEWKETTAIRATYCLARRIQALYNDFVDARDTGTVSPWEVYGIYLLMENLMLEFARATANRDEIWKAAIDKLNELTPKNIVNFFFAHYAEFSEADTTEEYEELTEKYGEDSVKLMYAFGILYYTHRIVEEYFYAYAHYISSYGTCPIFDIPKNCIIVENPPAKFKLMPFYTDCQLLRQQFFSIKYKFDEFRATAWPAAWPGIKTD